MYFYNHCDAAQRFYTRLGYLIRTKPVRGTVTVTRNQSYFLDLDHAW